MGKHAVKDRNLKKLKAFGAHLKQLRTDAGLTQEQLADRAGISENTIATIEAGKLNTSVATCFELAKALGMPAKTLFDF